jgi:hypothetical protein
MLEQWSRFWLFPAGFAAAVLIFFAVLFRPRQPAIEA